MQKSENKGGGESQTKGIEDAFTKHESNGLYQYREFCAWKELIDFYYEDFLKQKISKWLFRGDAFVWKNKEERRMKCAFKTSLDKAFDDGFEESEIKPQDAAMIEKAVIRSFRRRAHLLNADKDGTQTHLETFALLRHHFGPARILDWMYSFFSAVYFAVNRYDKGNRYTVWALNNKWLKCVSDSVEDDFLRDRDYLLYHFGYIEKKRSKSETKKYSDIKREFEYYKRYDNNRLQSLVITYLMNKNAKSLIYAANPYRLNERLAVQRGVLLFCGTIKKTWGENLRDVINNPPNRKQTTVGSPILWEISLKLSKHSRSEFLRRLDEMNINQVTLFPDLDGFAQSLTRRIAYPESLGVDVQ